MESQISNEGTYFPKCLINIFDRESWNDPKNAKKRGSSDIKNLLDFAIFSILSYQCDIIRYNHIISQKFSL